MSSWKEFVQYHETVEPPPELPLHSFMIESNTPRAQDKKFVDRLKGWFSSSSSNANPQNQFLPEDAAVGVTRSQIEDENSRYIRTKGIVDEIPAKKIYLVNQDPFENENQNLAEESAKTFLTGNDVDKFNIPQFPKPTEELQICEDDFRNGALGDPSLVSKPISQILKDPSILSNLSSSLHGRNATLRTVTKRLSAVANKKSETFKLMQKFSKDLFVWGQNSAAENADSIALVNEIQELFQMDLILEQKISEKLKHLTKELEYICLRQDELSLGKKNLLYAIKKYDYSKNKKGEDKEETNLLREKVIAQERSYEAYKSHYQYSISVTARQIFKDVGIEYYERASDLKEATGNYLKTTLQSLEINNSESFVKDFEKLRILRAERNWSKLNPDEKNNPQSWVDLVSGKRDGNDTLMKKICQGLPQAYTPIPKNVPLHSPKLNFQTGLEESISGIPTERFNPITSNEFFLEKSPNKELQKVFYGNINEDDTNGEKKDDNNENLENAESEAATNSVKQEGLKVRNSKNMLNIRKSSNNLIPVWRESTDRKHDKSETQQKNTKQPSKNGPGNGFILNFGNISQQFNDAEKHLQENRWIETPL